MFPGIEVGVVGGASFILGNYIGLDKSGTAAEPNGNSAIVIDSGVTIGGPNAIAGTGAGNLIAGNQGSDKGH